MVAAAACDIVPLSAEDLQAEAGISCQETHGGSHIVVWCAMQHPTWSAVPRHWQWTPGVECYAVRDMEVIRFKPELHIAQYDSCNCFGL
jgi:hypothetical protein